MNPGQEKFMDFILENVREDGREEAERLLHESFSKQDNGTFDHAYMDSFVSSILPLVKAESLEQVKDIMVQFKKGI